MPNRRAQTFLDFNPDLAKETPDFSLQHLRALLKEEEELYSPQREPELIGGRGGMAWEIMLCGKQLDALYQHRPEGNKSMYMDGKVYIAECHGRINERIVLMDEFEKLLHYGMEIIRETPGYSPAEATSLRQDLNAPTNRVRSELELTRLKKEVAARKKMVEKLRRKKQERDAFAKSPVHGVTRTLSNLFHELGKNDRHEVPLVSGRREDAAAWTTTRQARRYARMGRL